MDSADATQILILVILLVMSAFFSSAETSLTMVNKIKIRRLAEQGNKRAVTVLKITSTPSKLLSAILIGNNVVNLYASSLATSITIKMFGNKFIGIATGILTLLILVFGEITPKSMATRYAENVALAFGEIIKILMIILTPVIIAVNYLSGIIMKLTGADPDKKQDPMTEEELRTIVEVSHEEGVIENEEKKIINNVFDFGDTVARDIMIPRIDMTFVNCEASYDELINLFREERYTRIPVYEKTSDNVIGIINVKDLLLMDKSKEFKIRDYLREPFYTYEQKKNAELMVEMRKTFNNIVIVLDEYGATAGLITLEDMLEEIVGEIRDEYDFDEEEEVIKIRDSEYIVDASVRLENFNEKVGTRLESEDYESLGGLVLGILDHVPNVGEEVTYDGVRLVINAMDKARIAKIHVYVN